MLVNAKIIMVEEEEYQPHYTVSKGVLTPRTRTVSKILTSRFGPYGTHYDASSGELRLRITITDQMLSGRIKPRPDGSDSERTHDYNLCKSRLDLG